MTTKTNYLIRLALALVSVFILWEQSSYSQSTDIEVSGVVLDMNSVPVPGASVVLADRAGIGSVTDADGEFSISVRKGETLKVSSIGFQTEELKVVNGKFLKIYLKDDIESLSEVVVVGYGTSSKVKLTGSVSTVSTDDFKNRPLTDVSLALQGKVTGVQVTQNSGQPGADGGTITVRGIGTLNDSSPLVIIDGFESSFDKVDPKDIESISVLKDAASAAIYGNKAANGVILITTKSGKTGKLSVEYNGYVSVQEVTRYPELLNSVEYMTLYNEACRNSGMSLRYSDDYISKFDGTDLAKYPDRDWSEYYFKPAFLQNHYLKFNGGTGNVAYSLSLGMLDQDGILRGTDFKKYTFRSNTNTSFFKDRLLVSTNLSGYYGDKTDLVQGTGSTLARIVQMNPMVKDKIEGIGWMDWFYDDAVKEAGGYNKNKISSFTGNIKFDLNILSGLNLIFALNYDQTTDLGQKYAPNVVLYNIFTGADGSQHVGESNTRESSVTESTRRYGSLSSYATLSYKKNLGNHFFGVLAGWQQSSNFDKYYQASRTRLSTNLPSLQIGDSSTQKNSSWETEVKSISYFARINYDYRSRYLFEANMRYDGSSKFSDNNKWGFFPSFAVAWRVSEENFLKRSSFVDELKVRASWGQLGNEKIWSAYAGKDILSIGTCNYIWENQEYTGAATSYIANKDLTWETTTQLNVGLDFSFLRHLTFTADFYHKTTSDILMRLPVSGIFGFTEDPWKNAGVIENIGGEFMLAYSAAVGDLRINSSVSVSLNRNKIIDLKGQSPIINSNTGIILQEGLPINTLYGYEIEGIYQNEAEIHDHLQTFDRDGNPVNSYSGLIAEPGDIRFKDQNNDGIIDLDNDRVPLGDPNPDFMYSGNLQLAYKGFDFTLFFQGLQGGKGWSTGELVSPFFNNYNSAAWMVNRWTPENPNNTYQRVYIDNQRAQIQSEYYVEDLSYLRLKNLELGYNFTDRLIKSDFISNMRIYLSAQNLLTLTRYKGFDPERAGVEATNIYSYPLVKTFTLGLNLTF